MACIHCAVVQGYLLALIVLALLGPLQLDWDLPRGLLYWGNARVSLYVAWETWEAPNTNKQILILIQEIFFCQWKRVWFTTYIIQFQALGGRFAVTFDSNSPF